jgi:hypothetical protein
MDNVTASLIAGALIVIGAQALATWRNHVVLGRVRRFDERLAHVCDALALLAETTEAGLENVAGEIERLAAAEEPSRESRRSTRRIASAARRGRTVQEIAAEEAVSEGEVRLRLHLAEGKATPGETGPGSQAAASDATAATAAARPAQARGRRVTPPNGSAVARDARAAASVEN